MTGDRTIPQIQLLRFAGGAEKVGRQRAGPKADSRDGQGGVLKMETQRLQWGCRNCGLCLTVVALGRTTLAEKEQTNRTVCVTELGMKCRYPRPKDAALA